MTGRKDGRGKQTSNFKKGMEVKVTHCTAASTAKGIYKIRLEA